MMNFSKLDGLIPAVVQDHVSGEVLMVGFMNPEAWEVTQRTGYVTFFSRTRSTLWTKGETSGNLLGVQEIRTDCDADALVLKCIPVGPTCHTNETSCFYRLVDSDGTVTLAGDGVAPE